MSADMLTYRRVDGTAMRPRRVAAGCALLAVSWAIGLAEGVALRRFEFTDWREMMLLESVPELGESLMFFLGILSLMLGMPGMRRWLRVAGVALASVWLAMILLQLTWPVIATEQIPGISLTMRGVLLGIMHVDSYLAMAILLVLYGAAWAGMRSVAKRSGRPWIAPLTNVVLGFLCLWMAARMMLDGLEETGNAAGLTAIIELEYASACATCGVMTAYWGVMGIVVWRGRNRWIKNSLPANSV